MKYIDKEVAAYIPDIKFIRELQKHFDGDLNGPYGIGELSFDEYLCALAYGCLGKELCYDSRVEYKLGNELKNNDTFMQGMLTYSILTKIAKVKQIMESLDFQKNKKIDFSHEDEQNDYATIAFALHYLNTKGHKVEWDKISHAYTPININGPVSFSKSKVKSTNDRLDLLSDFLDMKKSL